MSLLKEKNNYLYSLFTDKEIQIEVFLVEWAFSLFSSIMPVEVHIDFFIGFFAEGWDFFYKTCLILLESNEKLYNKEIIQERDDIYFAIRLEKSNETFNKEKNIKYWQNIINRAYII